MITLPPATTALILIDLQKGLRGTATAPCSMAEVLAKRFRAAGAPIVLVNAAFSADFGDVLKTPVGRAPQARAAQEHGYGVVLAEDAITAHTAEMHGFAFEHIFPRCGRVAKASEIKLQG
jgi:nicotinamidase-related amidase